MSRKIDPILLFTLVLALFIRWQGIRVAPADVDELTIIHAAQGLARHGEWTWLGNQTTFSLIAGHSPFTTYVTAIPALIFPHPLHLRLFYAGIGLITILLTYLVLRQLIGRMAANSAALLLAVMPLAVEWSSIVWNLILAQPFIVIWLYTAFIGYERDRKWAQVAHWLSLSFAMQSQAALLAMMPLSVLISAYGLWQARHSWRSFIRQHSLILALCLLTLLPWIIGNYGYAQGWWGVPITLSLANSPETGQLTWHIPIDRMIETFGVVTSSATYRRSDLLYSDNPAVWWFPADGHTLLYLHTIVILGGSLLLTVTGFRKRDPLRLFALLLLISLVWSLGLFFAGRAVSNFYLMLTVFSAVFIFGWLVQIIGSYHRALLLLPLLFIASQLWLTASILSWYGQQSTILPYQEMVTYVEQWQADDHDILVWDVDPPLYPKEQREWRLHWLIMSEVAPIRYTDYAASLVFRPQRQRIVGTDLGQVWFYELLHAGQTVHNDQRDLTAYQLDYERMPAPNYSPATDAHTFGTEVAQVIGAYHDERLTAAETLTFWLYWQPLQSTTATHQFSLRIVDSDGHKLAQHDQLSLPAPLWRIDDTVISQFALPIEAALPDNWHLELLMYTYPDGITLPIAADTSTTVMILSENDHP